MEMGQLAVVHSGKWEAETPALKAAELQRLVMFCELLAQPRMVHLQFNLLVHRNLPNSGNTEILGKNRGIGEPVSSG